MKIVRSVSVTDVRRVALTVRGQDVRNGQCSTYVRFYRVLDRLLSHFLRAAEHADRRHSAQMWNVRGKNI